MKKVIVIFLCVLLMAVVFVVPAALVSSEGQLHGLWLENNAGDAPMVIPDDGSLQSPISQDDPNGDGTATSEAGQNTPGEMTDNILPYHNKTTKTAGGVQYTYTGTTVKIIGMPTKSSYLNLCGGENSIPDNLRAGELLKIQFESGTAYVSLGIRAFSEEHPDGVWLMKTSVDTEFVVPDLSEYTGVSIRIVVSQCDRKLDLTVTPSIQVDRTAYLTIIDDDGDIHFLTDLFPLMEEMQVPISSAVTIRRIGSAKRWMDWDDITYLHQNGCEILNHTYNHYTGTEIQSVDDAAVYEDYQKSRDELLSRGIPGGEYLVYSSSSGNYQRIQSIAAQLFKCGIKIGGSAINTKASDRFALSRYRIDYAATEGHEDWNLNDLKSYVDDVSSVGGWQIMMLHTSNAVWRQRVCLDDQGNVLYENGAPVLMADEKGDPVLDVDGSYPTWGSEVLVPMLRELILYARAHGVKIVSVKEAYHAMYE